MKQYTEEGLQLYKVLTQLDAERRKAFQCGVAREGGRLVGLSARQNMALIFIKELTSQEPDGISLKTLAQHLNMAVSATSAMVDHMVRKHLVQRAQALHDKRAVRITLTAEGESEFLSCNASLLGYMNELAQRLNKSELRTLQKVVNKFSRKRASRHGRRTSAGPK